TQEPNDNQDGYDNSKLVAKKEPEQGSRGKIFPVRRHTREEIAQPSRKKQFSSPNQRGNSDAKTSHQAPSSAPLARRPKDEPNQRQNCHLGLDCREGQEHASGHEITL